MEDNTEDKATEEQMVFLQNIIERFKNTECKTEKFLYEKIEKAIDINSINEKKASKWIDFFKQGHFVFVLRNYDNFWWDRYFSSRLTDSENLKECFFMSHCKKFRCSVIETLKMCLEKNGKEENDDIKLYTKEYTDRYKETAILMAVDTVLFATTYDR